MIRSSRGPRGIVVGLLALMTGALLLWHDLLPNIGGSASLVETFLPWLGVFIVVLGVAALVRLSVFGTLCVAAAAAVWGTLFLPTFLPGMHAGAPSLTVASENIHAQNSAAGSIAKDLADRAPDVIALQELDATSRETVSAVLAPGYPHSAIVGTVGLWSKYPISDEQRLDLGLGWDRAVRVDLDTPGTPTRVYAVHIASVRPGAYQSRDTMLAELAETVKADDSAKLIVVGDFNTASTDRKFQPLLSTLTEAPDNTLGFGFTWPAEFPVARLDHVLVRGLTNVTSDVLADNGSDHRGILVGVR